MCVGVRCRRQHSSSTQAQASVSGIGIYAVCMLILPGPGYLRQHLLGGEEKVNGFSNTLRRIVLLVCDEEGKLLVARALYITLLGGL